MLGGIIVALSFFVILCVIYASIGSGAASAALADSHGVDSTPWWTGDGILAGLGSVFNVAVAAVIYGLFGALLGVATRSSAISIAAGIAYFLLSMSGLQPGRSVAISIRDESARTTNWKMNDAIHLTRPVNDRTFRQPYQSADSEDRAPTLNEGGTPWQPPRTIESSSSGEDRLGSRSPHG